MAGGDRPQPPGTGPGPAPGKACPPRRDGTGVARSAGGLAAGRFDRNRPKRRPLPRRLSRRSPPNSWRRLSVRHASSHREIRGGSLLGRFPLTDERSSEIHGIREADPGRVFRAPHGGAGDRDRSDGRTASSPTNDSRSRGGNKQEGKLIPPMLFLPKGKDLGQERLQIAESGLSPNGSDG